jgi:DNA-binding MarR family transcriptional regulator/GNAT superfamily N-acetyltransferase
MPSELDLVSAVRRFSRFYTAALGTLEEGILHTSLSLAEARLLFEIATSEEAAASDIAVRMKLDPGYISRLVGKFETAGLIRRKASASDARRSILSLTAAGRRQFAALNERSNEEVRALIAPLNSSERTELQRSLSSIERLLGHQREASASSPPFMLRHHQPGDMGIVTSRHGALYAQEYGWHESFESFVARIAADFIDRYDPRWERCWIAERDSDFLGCVFLVKDRENESTAKLRLLLVEPKARGLGLGHTLVRQCGAFARQAGYSRIVLWTNSVLTAARRIYEGEGYRLVREEAHQSFGKKLVGQYWELVL